MHYYGSQYLFQQLFNNKKTMVVIHMAFFLHVSAHNGLFQGGGYKHRSSYGYLY